ncbi:carboxypeptidase-like regulatory domain-containing protein [Ekhidna sp.]
MKQINLYVRVLGISILIYILLHFLIFPELGKEKVSLTETQKEFILKQHVSFGNILADSVSNYDSLLNQRYEIIGNFLNCCEADSTFNQQYELAFEVLESDSFALFLNELCWEKDSIFWLDSKWVLIEVLVWSLFGVLCSLLFHGSEAVRNNKFDPKEIAVHYSKLVYSPVITVVIIFSGNVLVNDGAISVDGISYWVIVLSFILGFYSRRAIDLLDRIKDLIFRSSDPKKEESEVQLTLNGSIDFDPSVTAPPVKEISNATILLQSASSDFESDIINPDSKGAFSFSGLTPDEYSIAVELIVNNKEYEIQTTIKLDEASSEGVFEILLIEVTNDDGDDG